MSQGLLDFDVQTNFSLHDYIVTDANKDAFSYVQVWPDWPAHTMGRICIIYGPANSGKSYLANLWASKAGATYFDLSKISDLSDINSNIIVENIENFLPKYEHNFFHIINMVAEKHFYALFTTTQYHIATNLADLSSRLRAANMISISQPDDEMLAALLYKQLLDRQLKFAREIIYYIIMRIDRNFTAIKEIVDKIDKYSLETKRYITISFIKEFIL